MNIVEFTKEFQKMEIEEKLFERTTTDNIHYWDIVRHDVFYLIFRDHLCMKNNTKIKNTRCNKMNMLFNIANKIKRIVFDIYYLLTKSDSEYMMFTCSRNITNGKIRDIISEDYLNIIGNESFIVETFIQTPEKSNYSNSLLYYFKKINLLFKKQRSLQLDEIIKNRFGVNIYLDSFISPKIDNYKIEVKYYQKLLKYIRPKIVFFVQNGIQKSLIQSCRNLNIPTIELQHGYVNYNHPAYSYHENINNTNCKEVIVPNLFFTFSEYWSQNVNYPVGKIIPMGNSNYSTYKFSLEDDRNQITFISTNIYQEKIESYLDALLEHDKHTIINLKLHPNQIYEKDSIKLKYANHENLHVFCNEIELKDLYIKSSEVIVVSSTAAYEALQAGCCLGILLDDSSYDLIDVFSHPNVRIIRNLMDLLKPNNKYVSSDIVFFNPFNKFEFCDFISKANKGQCDIYGGIKQK